MKKVFSFLVWLIVAVLGAGAYATLALHRGEHLNSVFILTAALCTYAIGYHPPNFSETFFQRIDGALTEIDRHLASAGTGPVVYARMSELTKAFPRP